MVQVLQSVATLCNRMHHEVLHDFQDSRGYLVLQDVAGCCNTLQHVTEGWAGRERTVREGVFRRGKRRLSWGGERVGRGLW